MPDNLISTKQIRQSELSQFVNNTSFSVMSGVSGVLQVQINNLTQGSGIALEDVPFRAYSFVLNQGQQEISIAYDFSFENVPAVVVEVNAPINSPIIGHHVYNKTADGCFISLSNAIPSTGYAIDLIIGLAPQG